MKYKRQVPYMGSTANIRITEEETYIVKDVQMSTLDEAGFKVQDELFFTQIHTFLILLSLYRSTTPSFSLCSFSFVLLSHELSVLRASPSFILFSPPSPRYCLFEPFWLLRINLIYLNCPVSTLICPLLSTFIVHLN